MPRGHDVHVIATTMRGSWAVMHGGRTLSHHRTQKRAVSVGRQVARQTRVELVTHGCTGRIRSKDSYGNEGPSRDTEH